MIYYMRCWVLVLVAASLVGMVRAELPILHKKQWLGCFAVYEGRCFDFSMRARGEMTLRPKLKGGDSVAVLNRLGIRYGVEEVLPDGSTVFKELQKDGFSSEQEATDDLDRVVLRGRVTGDAEFEMVLEESRGTILIGGRVVDPGELKKYPLRFTVRVAIPNVYRTVEIEGRSDERAFARKTHRDFMEVKRLDGSRMKLTNDDGDDLDGEELSGSGLSELEMRLSYYEGRTFQFLASRHSSMSVTAPRGGSPWYEGLVLHWWPDAGMDPDGLARLSVCVR